MRRSKGHRGDQYGAQNFSPSIVNTVDKRKTYQTPGSQAFFKKIQNCYVPQKEGTGHRRTHRKCVDVNLSEESGLNGSGNKTLLKLLEQNTHSNPKVFINSNQNTPTVHRTKKVSEGDLDKIKQEESHRRMHKLSGRKIDVGQSQPPRPQKTDKTVYLRKNVNFENISGTQAESVLNKSDRFTKESIQLSDYIPKKGKSKRKSTRIFDSVEKRSKMAKMKSIEEPSSRKLPQQEVKLIPRLKKSKYSRKQVIKQNIDPPQLSQFLKGTLPKDHGYSFEDCNVTGSGDESHSVDDHDRKLIPDSLAFRRSPQKTPETERKFKPNVRHKSGITSTRTSRHKESEVQLKQSASAVFSPQPNFEELAQTESSTDREDENYLRDLHSESPEPPIFKRREEDFIRRLRISLFNKPKIVKFETIFFSPKSHRDVTSTLLSFLPLPDILQVRFITKKSKIKWIARLIRKCVNKLALNGFSTMHRLLHWNYALRLFRPSKNGWVYTLALKQELDREYEWIIDRDVERTFTSISHFQQGHEGATKLRNILKAMAVYFVKSVGYCQGMNFVAASILTNLNREDYAFWMLQRMFKRKKMSSLYNEHTEMKQVRLLCFVLQVALRFYRHDFWEFFEALGIKLEYCTSKWFLTMFAYDSELELALTAIDIFIISGWKGLVRIALALIEVNEEDFQSKDYDEAMMHLNTLLGRRGLDTQKLFEISDTYRAITNKTIEEIENQAFDNLDFDKAIEIFQNKRDVLEHKKQEAVNQKQGLIELRSKEILEWKKSGIMSQAHSPARSQETSENITRETVGFSKGPTQLETSNIQMNPTTSGLEDDCNIIDTPIFKNTMEYLSDQNIKLASGDKVVDKLQKKLKAVKIERDAEELKISNKSNSHSKNNSAKTRNLLSPPKPIPKVAEQITFTRIDSSFNKSNKRTSESRTPQSASPNPKKEPKQRSLTTNNIEQEEQIVEKARKKDSMFRKFWSTLFGKEKPRDEIRNDQKYITKEPASAIKGREISPLNSTLAFDFMTPKERSMSWNTGKRVDIKPFIAFLSPHQSKDMPDQIDRCSTNIQPQEESQALCSQEEVQEEEKPGSIAGQDLSNSQRLPALAQYMHNSNKNFGDKISAASPPSGKEKFYKLGRHATNVSQNSSLNIITPLQTPSTKGRRIYRTPEAGKMNNRYSNLMKGSSYRDFRDSEQTLEDSSFKNNSFLGMEYQRIDPKDVKPEMEQFTIKNIDTGEVLIPNDLKY